MKKQNNTYEIHGIINRYFCKNAVTFYDVSIEALGIGSKQTFTFCTVEVLLQYKTFSKNEKNRE